MWCRSCQQDVPAVASKDDATVRCARCHANVSAKAATAATPEPEIATTETAPERRPALESDTLGWSNAAPPVSWASWELAEDLRAADRMVQSLGIRRIDAAHDPPSDAAPSRSENVDRSSNVTPRTTPGNSKRPHTNKTRRGSFATWTILSLGLMTFAFGSVLLGCSFWMERADLWRLGMPFTMAGQAALVIGLIFQLDGLWRSNQAATETLDELDEQLDELRRATSLLSTTHSGPSQSFYSHMAAGAGPQLLLADLKSQLDLLAIKLGEEKR